MFRPALGDCSGARLCGTSSAVRAQGNHPSGVSVLTMRGVQTARSPARRKSEDSMVKGRCIKSQIFVVHEDTDRLVLSGWTSLEDTHAVVRDIVPILCPDCRRRGKSTPQRKTAA